MLILAIVSQLVKSSTKYKQENSEQTQKKLKLYFKNIIEKKLISDFKILSSHEQKPLTKQNLQDVSTFYIRLQTT